MKSRRKLFKDVVEIVEQGIAKATVPSKPQDFNDETYGRNSMIYVRWATPEDRKIGEMELRIRGHKITRYDEKSTSQIQVSYFKGHHWNE